MTLPCCYDLRHEQPDPPALPKTKHKIVRGKVARRPWTSITGVTIHQTACQFGVTPAQVRAAGGDRDLALARRALGVACHGLAFRRGFYVLANPLDWYVWHGNGLNEADLGLEVEGIYPGLLAQPVRTTWGGQPTELTDEVIDAARECLRHMVQEARASGAPLRYVHAHRQSSATRRSDPGEGIWRRLVLDFAVPVLGLQPRPARTWGAGRPIPVAWDPVGGVGEY